MTINTSGRRSLGDRRKNGFSYKKKWFYFMISYCHNVPEIDVFSLRIRGRHVFFAQNSSKLYSPSGTLKQHNYFLYLWACTYGAPRRNKQNNDRPAEFPLGAAQPKLNTSSGAILDFTVEKMNEAAMEKSLFDC